MGNPPDPHTRHASAASPCSCRSRSPLSVTRQTTKTDKPRRRLRGGLVIAPLVNALLTLHAPLGFVFVLLVLFALLRLIIVLLIVLLVVPIMLLIVLFVLFIMLFCVFPSASFDVLASPSLPSPGCSTRWCSSRSRCCSSGCFFYFFYLLYFFYTVCFFYFYLYFYFFYFALDARAADA